MDFQDVVERPLEGTIVQSQVLTAQHGDCHVLHIRKDRIEVGIRGATRVNPVCQRRRGSREETDAEQYQRCLQAQRSQHLRKCHYELVHAVSEVKQGRTLRGYFESLRGRVLGTRECKGKLRKIGPLGRLQTHIFAPSELGAIIKRVMLVLRL